MAGLEGKKLGEFEIISKLGEGGMGLVFLGRQPSLGRQVAIKTLWPHFAANDRFVERFHREANAAALLNHPNIIQVYTAGVQDGMHYIAMEYVPGKSLREKIDGHGRLEPVESIAICVHVAQALKYAWEHAQIIHRDIKPENILISNEGAVKVADLGLAKQLGDAATGVTMSGVSMGSPHYISPEQAHSARDVDFRTDIYSLGCTLFHMLSGRPPYEGDEAMGVMLKHINEPMPDILSRVPNCPAPMVALLKKMLAKERDKRYRSYDELLADLLATHDRITAAAFAPVKRRDPMLWYAGAASVAIVAIVGLLIWAPWKSRNAPAPAPGGTGVAPQETTPQSPVTAAKPPLTGQTKTQTTEPARTSTPQPAEDVNWGPWEELFDGQSLEGWRLPETVPVEPESEERVSNGTAKVVDGQIVLTSSPEAKKQAWTFLVGQSSFPRKDYEIEVEAKRLAGGSNLFILLLPVGADEMTLLVGGGQGANTTTFLVVKPEPKSYRWGEGTGRWFRARVRVTTSRVGLWLDDQQVADLDRKKHRFSRYDHFPPEIQPITLGTRCNAAFRTIRFRRLRPAAPTADDAFVKEVAALPAEEQVNRVVAKLRELNPGFDGKETHRIEGGQVVKLELQPPTMQFVTNLAPIRALVGLRELTCGGYHTADGKTFESELSSLTSLQGLRLTHFCARFAKIEDLTPLAGMRLYVAHFRGNKTLRDLTPLKGMPLSYLGMQETDIDDLSPLAGMRLTTLNLEFNRRVKDLSPLRGTKLESVGLRYATAITTLEPLSGMPITDMDVRGITVDLTPLQGMPLKTIVCDFDPTRHAFLRALRTLETINDVPAVEFWKQVDSGITPAATTEGWSTLSNGWRVGKPVNLGPVVNSDKIEGSPAASADGLTLLFHSNRPGTQGGRALWMCRRQRTSEPWGPPINLSQGVNSNTRDTDACLAPDDLTLWFASTRPGGQGGNDLWMCTRRAATDPWGPPVNLGPTVNSRYDDGDPSVSADGLTLTFSSDRPGGQGGSDLWISTRSSVSQPWQAPVNLGPQVTSSAHEFCACLSPDGLALVFDSERSGGQGSRDLWMCTRRSTAEPFGEAVNLGALVNTANSDGGPSLSADGRTLYFHSDRPGGTGDFDLWQGPLLPPDAEATLRADGPWIYLFHSPAELAECEQSGSVRLENGTLHLSGEGSVRVPLGAQDVIVRAKIKRVSGPHLSLRLRLSQPRGRLGVNGYAAVLKEKSCSVDVTKSSAWNALAVGRTTTTQPNEYTEVLFSAVGNTLILYIDGKSVIETQREVELFSGDLAIAVSEGEAMVRDVAIQVLDKGWILPDWMKLATAAQLDDDTRWGPWEDLFDGKTLEGWRVAEGGPGGAFNEHGDVTVANGHLLLGQGKKLTGLSWTGEFPTTNYEIRCRAMRREGGREGECCSLVFPVGDSFAELSVGGWYNSRTGIQCVDGARGNNTPHMRGHGGVDTGVWHDIRVRVTDARLQAWVDGAPIADLPRAEHKFSPDSYSKPCLPFGLWYSGAEGVVQSVRLRRLKAGGTGAMKASAWKVYTEWPFDDSEAKRRQVETATALGVPVHQDIDLGNGVKMAMVLIPAGEFLLGSAPTTSPQQLQATYGGSLRDYERELPQHRVRISKPFWLGKYEVTQEQWQCVFQNNPSANKNQPKNPVENVELNQADDFIKALNAKLGKTFRLPTEAEWEYACRAGTTSEFYFGDDAARLAEFGFVRAGSTAPVGQKTPNAWGLYDMIGNVWEWCSDWFGKYDGIDQTDPTGAPTRQMRVLRGGSWNYAHECSRTAFRHLYGPGGRNPGNGLRLVLVPELPAGATDGE